MICLLVGHEPVTERGRGDFQGRYVVMCARCGKTYDQGKDVPKPRGFESAAADHFRQKDLR